MLDNIFSNIGQFGPIILFLFSLFLLQKKQTLLFYYIVGFFSNAILNLVLKGIIKQPRPNEEDTKLFDLAIKNGHRFSFKNGIPHDIYGMPSGHAESCLYSTLFIYLALKQKNILYFYLAISIITMAQRVIYNMHTVIQVIVGAIVGGLFGYCIYKLARSNIQGKITEKLDDFGPI
jgi:membrane-associated phospholipid phosphatase